MWLAGSGFLTPGHGRFVDGVTGQLRGEAGLAKSPMLQKGTQRPQSLRKGTHLGRPDWNESPHLPLPANPTHSENDSKSELSIQEVMGSAGEEEGRCQAIRVQMLSHGQEVVGSQLV